MSSMLAAVVPTCNQYENSQITPSIVSLLSVRKKAVSTASAGTKLTSKQSRLPPAVSRESSGRREFRNPKS
jgi:hypothetical protein